MNTILVHALPGITRGLATDTHRPTGEDERTLVAARGANHAGQQQQLMRVYSEEHIAQMQAQQTGQ